MPIMKRITGARCACVVALLLAAIGCRPGTQNEIDPAVALYLEGRYDEAIEAFESLLDTADNDDTRNEIYYFLGRSYMAKDDMSAAVDAFSAGVHLGDRGPCLEYLQMLQPRFEGAPAAIRRLPAVTRGQLSALVIRWVAAGHGAVPSGVPIEQMAERGWLRRLPDGQLHPEAEVTRASLHVFMARMCADIGCVGGTAGAYPLSDETITGIELLQRLERVMPWPVPDSGDP
jgi:tetratricopeptide (TPR) repeat protein